MYPFLQKSGQKFYLKLHSQLYEKSMLEEIKKEEPGYIKSINARDGYYFIDLNARKAKDYFEFLNSLIYLERNK
ncbi:MAG: hypothetical protein WC412_01855 [Candidatus Omnitrophota bacterium]|jgi:hypothetical protein